MALDRRYFPLTERLGIETGDRVRFASSHGQPTGEGAVTLVWFGIEEAVDVRLDDGQKRTLYPTLDWIEPISKGDRDGG